MSNTVIIRDELRKALLEQGMLETEDGIILDTNSSYPLTKEEEN